ncbi:TrkH family potassium uptake protein [Clostridium sp. BJN0001]|uniref:TrkH family potassium uptake protein n=1 Tax=Clostridium sp. BJN0001 TaxID=2930219 RepID=UPI001FD4CE7D|nr:TrkH family potassium uptake protein [Clostridium sp. BJN0001]
MSKPLTQKSRLDAVQILAIGFLVLIVAGGILLSLPISSAKGNYTNLLDAIFTSTSAVCVTGLVTLDTGTYFSTFGQVVIIILIEFGGLGFMSITTFAAILIGKKITLRDRLIVQEAMNTFNIEGLVRMVYYVFVFTLSVQLFGALLLSTQFIPEYGLIKGLFFSIFHSISAFCNAGFDLFGHFNSLTGYSGNSVVILTISILIIIGGLGFSVLMEIYNYKNSKKFSINSKIVIYMTAFLVIFGTIFFFVIEFSNKATIGDMNFKNKILNSFFAAVTPRTAGFNTISTNDMTMPGKFLTIILMFIGGSPGSTAGGLKTTTFSVILLTIMCVLKGREETEVFERRLSKETVYKAFTMFFVAMTLVLTVAMVLSITEKNEPFINLLYEATSAFGTVGITTGVTQHLSIVGKIIIIITMYFGRVGPITVILAFISRKKKTGYKYPEAKILIG